MISKPPYPLVIFDWDGTLMDSVPRIVSSVQTLAVECLLPVPSVAAIHDIIGLSLPVALERLFGLRSQTKVQDVVNLYRDIYVIREQTPTPMFAGAVDLLNQLHEAGVTLAVATGKARPGLERAWAESQTKSLFKVARCAQEVASKPNPQMIEEILEATQTPATHALMVGDSVHDMEMARNAGVAAVGVTYGVHSAERLKAAQPRYIVDSLSQLQTLLLR